MGVGSRRTTRRRLCVVDNRSLPRSVAPPATRESWGPLRRGSMRSRRVDKTVPLRAPSREHAYACTHSIAYPVRRSRLKGGRLPPREVPFGIPAVDQLGGRGTHMGDTRNKRGILLAGLATVALLGGVVPGTVFAQDATTAPTPPPPPPAADCALSTADNALQMWERSGGNKGMVDQLVC